MDVRRLSQPVERLPTSPWRSWSSPARRLGNNMLSYQSCRNGPLRDQQSKSTHTGTRGVAIAMGTSSDSSSLDEIPLTVTRSQRRPAFRRHIVESDDEGDGAASCANPHPLLLRVEHLYNARQTYVTQTQAQRALQDRTNLAPVSLVNGTGLTSQPPVPNNGDAALQELGKPGILELAAILRSKERFDCTGTPALQSRSGLAAPPSRNRSDGSDDADSPPIRSIRAPRTGRRVILWNSSDSDSGNSSPPRVLGGSGLRLPSLGGPLGEGEEDDGCNQSPQAAVNQQCNDSFMLPAHSLCSSYRSAPVVERVLVPTSHRQSSGHSSLSFYSARSEGNDGVEGGLSNLGAALECLKLNYWVQSPAMSPAREPSSRPAHDSADPELEANLGCESEIGTEASRPTAVAGGSLLELSLLTKVPRRPQRQRDGRDIVGKAAAFLLGGGGPSILAFTTSGADCGATLASGEASDHDGIMHDLHGELQLLNHLQTLSLDGGDLMSAGAGDPLEDTLVGQDLPLDTSWPPSSASPSPSSASPPPRLLTQLQSSSVGGNLTSAGVEELHQDDAIDGQDLPSKLSPSSASALTPLPVSTAQSPLHVLAPLQTGPVEVMDLTLLSSSTITSPESSSTHSTSSTFSLGYQCSGNSDTDLDLQAKKHWKRPPTTPGRRAVILESSSGSEVSSPQQWKQQPEPPGAPLTGLQAGGHAGTEDGPISSQMIPGAKLDGSMLTMTIILGAKGPRDGKAPKGRKEVPSPEAPCTDARVNAMAGKARAKKGPRGTGLAAEQRAFLATRAQLAQEFYHKWNLEVFNDELPGGLPLVWNSRLTSTAGQVVSQRMLPGIARRVPARLELSPRLVDSLEKLRKTLSHEMCHVAAWQLSHEYDRPHGPAWQSWAHKFMRHDPSLVITRTHDYAIQYAHRWRCTGEACGKEYGRHRMTLSVDRHLCGVCRSKLEYLGHFDKHGNLKAAKAVTPRGPGSAAAAGGGRMTGTAAKPLSEFAKFCKENFRSVQASMPPRTPAPEVFKHMGHLYQKHKATITLTVAAGGGAVPNQLASGLGPGGDSSDPVQPPRGNGSARSHRISDSGDQRRSADESDSLSQTPVDRLTSVELMDLFLSEDDSQKVEEEGHGQ